jgi:hypothetical protein
MYASSHKTCAQVNPLQAVHQGHMGMLADCQAGRQYFTFPGVQTYEYG